MNQYGDEFEGDGLDAESLLKDIKLMAAYASRAGLIGDPELLAPVTLAEQALRQKRAPDLIALARVLSALVVVIYPMSLADLKAKRNPFLPKNQARSHRLQMSLAFFAFYVLLNIGFSMDYLRQEQEALTRLAEIRDSRPGQMLTDLRHLVQMELPSAREETKPLLSEKYEQKRAEYLQLNRQVLYSTVGTDRVALLPQLPLMEPLIEFYRPSAQYSYTGATEISPKDLAGASLAGKTGSSASPPGNGAAMQAAEDMMCAELDGELALPDWSTRYPKWLKGVLRDALTDDCLKTVVSPGGISQSSLSTPDTLTVARDIRDNISLRTVLFLPALFGILGATMYVMRHIGNIREPAMGLDTVLVRIALGGIAGVAIGWFATGDLIKIQSSTPISLSFILAFLTGYCLDMFFQQIERLSSSVTNSLRKQAAAAQEK